MVVHENAIRAVLSGFICLFLLSPPAPAQNITGTITGAVADPSGAGVPQAPVTALGKETGISYKTTTGAGGVYVLPLLPLGTYQVTIEAAGFRKFVRDGVNLTGDERLRVDARLEIGAVAEQMTVSAGAPLVATDQATLGANFQTSSFNNLPINRSVVGMLALVPGIQANAQGISVGNVNGSRDTVVDVKIDGVPATHTGNALFSIGPPINELVEEVIVQTASYSAEFGRGVGQVNFTTRGGANQPHGTVFYYFQNDALSANGFMNNFYGFKRAILRFNLYGGTFGGPVVIPKIYDGRNRTFFSFGYQGSQSRSLGQQVSTLPSSAMRAGNFSGQAAISDPATTRANPAGSGSVRDPFPGNIIPTNRIDSIASNILANSYPIPTLAGAANNYVNTGPSPNTANGTNVRVDHNFSDKSRITGRYTYRLTAVQNVPLFPGPAGGNGGNFILTNDTSQHIAAGDHVYVIRPDLVNNFHFGFYHMLTLQTPPGAAEDWSTKLGLQNLGPYLFPAVTITGLSSFGGGTYIQRPQANNFQYADSLTWIKGRHAIKAGAEYRNLRYANWAGNSGTFTFNTLPTMNPQTRAGGIGFASFLLGIPTTTAATAVQPPPAGTTTERWKSWSVFLQDDYKVTSNLTLNLGLRWELYTPRTVDYNHQSMLSLKTLQLDYAGQNGYPETLYDYNWKDFQPRLGFAYTPFGSTRTVIRGGYGIFYQAPNGAIAGFEVGPWSPSYTYTSPDSGITFPLTLHTAVPPASFTAPYILSSTTAVSWLPRTVEDAYGQQWSLNIQRELPHQVVAEVGYVGSRGVHLPLTYQLNQVPAALLGPGNAQSHRPYPTLGAITATTNPVGSSTYHALQARFEHRLSSSLSWRSVYTFSKSIDNASGFASSRSYGVVAVQDNYNLGAERSVSGFDLTHNFVASLAWQLPVGKGRRLLNHGGVLNAVVGGWTLSGISTLQGGRPLGMTTVTNLTGSLDGGSRPNRLASGQLVGTPQGRLNWFDPSAFALPAAFTFGNDSRSEPGLRGPGVISLDLLLAKEFRLRESLKLQFRTEAYNALNHFNPGTPNTQIGFAGVGAITTGNAGRNIQLALKLLF